MDTTRARRSSEAGFTLLEVIAAAVILGVIGTIAMVSDLAGSVAMDRSVMWVDLQNRTEVLLAPMVREIEGSSPSRLASPAPGASATSIVFQTRSALSDPLNGNLEWSAPITYAFNPGAAARNPSTITRTQNGVTQVICDRISSLTFSVDPSLPLVNYSVTASAWDPSGTAASPREAMTVSSSVALKNP